MGYPPGHVANIGKLVMVVHACNPITQEAEIAVQKHPGLQNTF